MVDRTMAALRPQEAVLGAQAVLAMMTATLRVPAIDAPITYPITHLHIRLGYQTFTAD